MSKASDFFGKSGSGMPLGSTIYIKNPSPDITIGGDRFLRTGYVETDTTGIDVSLVTRGAYYEPMNPNAVTTPWGASPGYISINDIETMLVANTASTIYRSIDGGEIWSTISVSLGGRSINGITRGAGTTWYLLASTGGAADGIVMKSLDDGLTWQSAGALPSLQADTYADSIYYSTYNDEVLVYFRSNSSLSNIARAYISSDGTTTWTDRGVGLATNNPFIGLPNLQNAGNWIIAGGTDNSTIITTTDDGGVTWRVMSLNPNFLNSKQIGVVWAIGDSMYVIATPAPASSTDGNHVIEFEYPLTASNIPEEKYKGITYYSDNEYPELELYNNPGLPMGITYQLPEGLLFDCGLFTIDGTSFERLRSTGLAEGGWQNSGFHRPTSGLIFANNTLFANYAPNGNQNSKVPMQRNIPIVGITQPHTQGGVPQYIKIQENL